MKPFIRWAGSKQQQLGILSEYWPGNGARYIEPFCGSAALFFGIEPKDAVLGDLNAELICTYRSIQLDVGTVLDCLTRLPKTPRDYYGIRATDPSRLSEAEQAARFLYLNTYCFNGLYRTNSQGEFNVPVGKSRSAKTINVNAIRQASGMMTNTVFVHGDFQRTLEWVRPGDFVYLDPPYLVSTRRVFSDYCANSFGSDDLWRLQNELVSLDCLGAQFVVSYAYTSEAKHIFSRWSQRRIIARRNIAGFSGARRRAYELIVTNIK